jgi:ABC-type phosphate transport system permease subunit
MTGRGVAIVAWLAACATAVVFAGSLSIVVLSINLSAWSQVGWGVLFSAALVGGAVALAFPFALAIAITLEAFARPKGVWRLVQRTFASMREVPPLAYGASLLVVGWGGSVLALVLVLALVVLPSMTQESRRVLRRTRSLDGLAAAALGLSVMEGVRYAVIPAVRRPLMGVAARACARALGAAAPGLLLIAGQDLIAVSIVRHVVFGDLGLASLGALVVVALVAALHVLASTLERRPSWRARS